MLNPDCLLKNTAFFDNVKKYMQYAGADMMESGKDPSFKRMYDHLRESGIEIDVESAGYAYHELFAGKEGYSKLEDIVHESGKEFEQSVWNKMVHEPTKDLSEKQIGNLPPAKEIVKRLVSLFDWGKTEDSRTASTIKSIQETYYKAVKDIFGAEKSEKGKSAESPWEETLQAGLEKMTEGYRDEKTGLINNLKTLHEAVNKELSNLTNKLRKEGEHAKADALEKAAKDIQSTEFAIALSEKEIKKITEGALMGEGYMKQTKSGENVVDWEKLSGETHSARQLREKVVAAMKKKGVDDFTAEKVAELMHRELDDAVKTMANIQTAKYDKDIRSHEKKAIRADASESADAAIKNAVDRWENFRQYEGQGQKELILSKKTAGDAMREILRSMGVFRNVDGKDWVQMDELEKQIDSQDDIRKSIHDHFAAEVDGAGNKKYTDEQVSRITDAMEMMAKETFDRLREHVEGKQEQIEKSWTPDTKAEPLKSIEDLIHDRLSAAKKYAKVKGEEVSMLFRRSDAKRIVSAAIKNSIFGKEKADGSKIIDWKKLGVDRPDEAMLDKAIKNYLESMGLPETEVNKIAKSLEPLLSEFIADIDTHAESILTAKEKASQRESSERGMAIQYLAELHTLGAFNGAHDELLKSVIGVSDMTKEDLQNIDNITSAYNEAMKELTAMDLQKSSQFFQSKVADQIDAIVARNINNRTAMLKTLNTAQEYFRLQNLMLISGTYNLFENFVSGQQGLIGGNMETRHQTGRLWSDRKLWWNTLMDEAIGATSGFTGEKFMGGMNALNKYNTFNFKKNPVKAIITSIVTPVRFALTGMDAANKAVSVNKAWIYLTHEALVQKGYSKGEATAFLSEMLTGQKKEQSLVEATKFVNKHWQLMGISDSPYAKKRASVRLANDFLKANIENATNDPFGKPNPLTSAILETIMKSGQSAAAISLGHEANNVFSRKIQAGRKEQEKLYREAIKNEEYGKAAKYKIGQIVLYDVIGRLAAGGVNWANLGFQYTGIPLLWKIPALRGLKKEAWTFDNKDALERQMRDRMETQRVVSRGITGLATFAAIAGSMALGGALMDDEEGDEDAGVFKKAQKGIAKSPVLEKLFKKSAGQLSLLMYQFLKYEDTDTKGALYGSLEFLNAATNINAEYSFPARMSKASLYAYRGQDEKAKTELGGIAGSYIWPGGFPFYRPYNEFYKFAKGLKDGEKIPSQKADGALEGLLWGGMSEDLANNFFTNEQIAPWGFKSWGKETESKKEENSTPAYQ